MGSCYKCSAKTSQHCVGCRQRFSYVCSECALPCAWCGDLGPYCTDCGRCKCENKNKCGEPGNHDCFVCEKLITLGSARAKCVNCDEFYAHITCLHKCSCGGEHYVCDGWEDEHRCQFNERNESTDQCPNYVCEENGRMNRILPGTSGWLLCPPHQELAKKLADEWVIANSPVIRKKRKLRDIK